MLSIIFVNYKNSDQIEKCLLSVEKYEANYREYEFIVVDNDSSDRGLAALKQKHPYLNILYAPKNGGFAYGNNRGIDVARGDVLLLLNPDTYLIDNSIEKLYAKIKTEKDISFIGPKLLFPDGSNQSYFEPKSYLTLWRLFCERLFMHRVFRNIKCFNSYFRTYMNYDEPAEVEQLSGCALMLKKELMDEIGAMDEAFFMYFEESDWCYRAVRSGLKLLYFPEAQVVHEGGLIQQGNWERSTRDYLTSFKYYFEKNFSMRHYRLAYLLFFAGTLIRAAGLLLHDRTKAGYYFYYLKYLLGKGR